MHNGPETSLENADLETVPVDDSETETFPLVEQTFFDWWFEVPSATYAASLAEGARG
jgi:hypothetical protein